MYVKVRQRYAGPKEKSRQNKLAKKKERKEKKTTSTAATAETKLIQADNYNFEDYCYCNNNNNKFISN